MKLLKFNEKRKTEKKSPKEEREEFFKEFGNYLMEIVDYVKVDIIPMFEKSPRDALLHIRKWNNTLNLKKAHETVQQIKSNVNTKIGSIFDAWKDKLTQGLPESR